MQALAHLGTQQRSQLPDVVAALQAVEKPFDLAGPLAVAGEAGVGFDAGQTWLVRQQGAIGGGTTEMARNNISERVLGMPREIVLDKNVPYRDVPKGRSGRGSGDERTGR